MSVIKHDFGKKKRQSLRRFRQLLTLDALHEANIRANPLPYLERASERIFRLRETLFEAIEAAKPPASPPEGEARLIAVDEAEFQRLKACLVIVEKGFATYGKFEDAF